MCQWLVCTLNLPVQLTRVGIKVDEFIVENITQLTVKWNPKIDVICQYEFYGYQSLPVDISTQFKAHF